MDKDIQRLSLLKFLGCAVVVVSMYLAYLCLLIKIDDAERYNMEMGILLALQHSKEDRTKQIYDDSRARAECRDYIHQLERQ